MVRSHGIALKHIFARDILPLLKQITETLHQVDNAGGRDFVAIVLQYLLERGELSDKEAFLVLSTPKYHMKLENKL